MKDYNKNDTIASLSTPEGRGAIAIVRVSGENSFEIVKRFFDFKLKVDKIESRKVYLGYWTDNEGLVDEVQVIFFKGKNTFTGEDLVEIYSHGGYAIPALILESILSGGARQSLPGEMTYRAYLNGKIDLVKSQAINDIINSKTSYSARFLARNLKGSFSDFITEMRRKILNLSASVEVQIDYPDEEFEEREISEIATSMESILNELEKVIDKSEMGMIIKRGVPVVIAGKPNVGKSTIMNRLLKQDRAIVTDVPGTTRDFIEEELNIKGVYVKLTDTAGLRGTDDVVEKIGIEKTLDKIQNSNLVVYIIDIERGIDEYDINILTNLGDKRVVLVLNKADKTTQKKVDKLRTDLLEIHNYDSIVVTSALSEKGVYDLENAIYEVLSILVKVDEDTYITNDLQKNYIKKVYSRIKNSFKALEEGITVDVIAQDLRECVELFDSLTGRSYDEDLSDTIFSNFCVGK